MTKEQQMNDEAYNKPEYILCAAIHYNNYVEYVHQPLNVKTGLVLCGRRHHNIIQTYSVLFDKMTLREETQGFLTSKNRFVNRKEAGEIAFKAKQITIPTDCLFSEDLY